MENYFHNSFVLVLSYIQLMETTKNTAIQVGGTLHFFIQCISPNYTCEFWQYKRSAMYVRNISKTLNKTEEKLGYNIKIREPFLQQNCLEVPKFGQMETNQGYLRFMGYQNLFRRKQKERTGYLINFRTPKVSNRDSLKAGRSLKEQLMNLSRVSVFRLKYARNPQ